MQQASCFLFELLLLVWKELPKFLTFFKNISYLNCCWFGRSEQLSCLSMYGNYFKVLDNELQRFFFFNFVM
jgi:hypothetical protein